MEASLREFNRLLLKPRVRHFLWLPELLRAPAALKLVLRLLKLE